MLIPTYHGWRMTRRLEGSFQFSSADHDGVWFSDAIGMIGDWRRANSRYSIPFRSIAGVKYHNLYAAGRCCAASLKGSDFMASGWDVTRVIPTCAVTGEAAGVAAALQSRDGLPSRCGEAPEHPEGGRCAAPSGAVQSPAVIPPADAGPVGKPEGNWRAAAPVRPARLCSHTGLRHTLTE